MKGIEGAIARSGCEDERTELSLPLQISFLLGQKKARVSPDTKKTLKARKGGRGDKQKEKNRTRPWLLSTEDYLVSHVRIRGTQATAFEEKDFWGDALQKVQKETPLGKRTSQQKEEKRELRGGLECSSNF